MNAKEAISQLESLKEHCESMRDGCGDDAWDEDVEALKIGIQALQAQLDCEQKVQQYTNTEQSGQLIVLSSDSGIVRSLDDLGRVVIPKEIRRHLKLEAYNELEVFATGDVIVIKKYSAESKEGKA